MTIEQKAEQYIKKENLEGIRNTVKDAYLAGYNEAAKWIEVTPETVITDMVVVRLKNNISGGVQYLVFDILPPNNFYWEATHYLPITPPKQ